MSSPKLCIVCNKKNGWYDQYRGQFSPYCSNTCRLSTQRAASQGQPICRMCSQPAYWDANNNKYSPGCGITHANQAIRSGYTTPR